MTIYRTMDTHCVRSFCKHVLGNPAEYADVETVEPDCYKSRKFKQVLDMQVKRAAEAERELAERRRGERPDDPAGHDRRGLRPHSEDRETP